MRFLIILQLADYVGKEDESKFIQSVFIRLKAQYPNTCVVILYHLEAAIRGVEMKQLDAACKAELKYYFDVTYRSSH